VFLRDQESAETTSPAVIADHACPSIPAFEARGLSVEFPGGVAALRGVDVCVEAGEILGVVGESGSGKSVLGLCALGLTGSGGRVGGVALLGGVDMVRASREERRLARRAHAGAVFQDPMTSLNPTKRVGLQLVEVAESRAAALELLVDVNVPEPGRRFDQFPHELSGGLRQRVMIAMALARNPTLVVADEPTTALDVTIQAEIVRLFRRLQSERQVAFMFITHDLALAAQVSDRLAVLYGGRVAEIGPTAAVIADPRHPYTAGLLATRLSLSVDPGARLRTLPGEPPDPRMHRDECPFVARCSFAASNCRDGLPVLRPGGSPGRFDACVRAGEISDPEAQGAAAGDVDHAAADSLTRPPQLRRRRSRLSRSGVRRRDAGQRSVDGVSDGDLDALAVSGLTKAFNGFVVVRDVSFVIGPGRALALVGESGCGKTTTLRIAVGLDRCDGGEVRVAAGARAQMIFQDVGASLTPWMRVGELLEERLRNERVAREQWPERIEMVLRLTGLSRDVSERRPARLSGGQRQRVALARAVIVPPPLLVCDEPTSALDVSLAATVLNLINRLRQELHMAVLIVTHDFGVARVAADDIAVMDDGAIVEYGPVEQLLGSPATAYTRRLLAAVPTIER
jgi:peptide/nickel transport system ATP-binding protein